MPIPNRYYEAVRGRTPPRLESIAASNRFYPVTDKVRQVDYHGGFTAAAGHALYTARTYPRHYWNQTAFVAEPTGHLVATFTLERKGSDVADYYGWNLVASDDEWTAPISAEVGPDGHVWVIDWYNYIVQHNPTPHGFKTGTGNAYETPLRDKTHGRIYRIVYKDAGRRGRPCSIPADAPGLVAALRNDNQFWRLHAQRLLVERGKTDVVPALDRAGARSLGRCDRPERRRDPCALDAARPGCPRRLSNRAAVAGRHGRAQASVGRRPPQCGAGLAARRAIGRGGSCRRLAARPGRPGAAGGAPEPGGSAAVGRGRRGRSPRRFAAGWRRRPWLADAAMAAAARNAESFLKALAHARKSAGRRPRAGDRGRAWPSTGPGAARPSPSARSWRP